MFNPRQSPQMQQKPSFFSMSNPWVKWTSLSALIWVPFLVWVFLLHKIETPPSYVTVLVDKPYIFGHGGVKAETQKPGLGWYWVTTEGVHVADYSFKIDEPFNDLPTRMQSFIDFQSYLKLRITDPVVMVSKFGMNGVNNHWYDHSMKEQYRTIVRNEARSHLMEDILSNPATITTMEANIRKEMGIFLKSINIPVVLEDVSLGRASPNAAVMTEIDNTSAQQQRIKSETARKLAEDSRKQAEMARAAADNAYKDAMSMSTNQYVGLEVAKQYAKACVESKNCVVVNGNAPVMVSK